MGNDRPPISKTEKSHDLSAMLIALDAQCQNCNPITPLQCINRCKAYKLKNELRRLSGTMDNPNYVKELLNALKNGTRLQILQSLVNGRCTVGQLQQELKRNGHSHSQETITAEYLRPLVAVGLAAETQDEYYATKFGGRLTERLSCFPEFAEKLPAHSECYEETLLQSLLSGPKTFEEIESVISPRIAPRTLKRLELASLVETPSVRDYVFFFRTRRDPNKEYLSSAQRKVYDEITTEGISAGRIEKRTGFSIRKTYKCLTCLKGKKLIFTRTTPKEYGLTWKGEKLASALEKLQLTVDDTWNSSQQVTRNNTIILKVGG